MATNMPKTDGEREYLAHALERVLEDLNGAGRELVIDFSPVRRIDAGAIAALQSLAGLAESKGVKIALRGVAVEVYKVLKLAKAVPRFTFTATQA